MEPCGTVDLVQAVGTVQITLVQQDNDLTALQRRDGRDTVNQERVGFGNGARGDDHQLVNVGHGRPGKSVLPGEGVVPIEEMLKNLNRIGYNGVVSAEIFSPSVQAMPIDMCLETVKQKTQQVMKNSEVFEKQSN